MTEASLARELDRRTAIVFGTAFVCLWGARFAHRWAPDGGPLYQMCWWAGIQIFFYLVVPLAALPLVRARPRDMGWRFRGTAHQWTKYAGLFVVAAPVVAVVSTTSEFQSRYPLFDVYPGGTDIWGGVVVWWVFYVVQFVAVENFFRGFLVQGLAPRFGTLSILVATLPYLMIHFTKPPLEATASVVGGIVMGTLALRTRSIVWGIALHVSIALLMDVLALGHKGYVW